MRHSDWFVSGVPSRGAGYARPAVGAFCVMHRQREISAPPPAAATDFLFPLLVLCLALAPPWAVVLVVLFHAIKATICCHRGTHSGVLLHAKALWPLFTTVGFYAVEIAIWSAGWRLSP